jgi:hypothetical protein
MLAQQGKQTARLLQDVSGHRRHEDKVRLVLMDGTMAEFRIDGGSTVGWLRAKAAQWLGAVSPLKDPLVAGIAEFEILHDDRILMRDRATIYDLCEGWGEVTPQFTIVRKKGWQVREGRLLAVN